MHKSIEMHRKILFSMIMVLSFPAVSAEAVALNPNHPQTYTVVSGDNLWDIAGRFLAQPWQWPVVWQVNPQIQNPNRIYPGDVITLTDHGGHPLLGLRRGGQEPGGRLVKLSPAVRESPHDNAIAPIALGAIRPFLTRPLVLTQAEIAGAATIIGNQDNRIAVGSGERVYVHGLPNNAGSALSVFRAGQVYRDPTTGAALGYEALPVADLVITQLGEPATGTVVDSNREILRGDLVLPQQEEEFPEFLPRAPEVAVDAQIISVMDGISQIGPHNVVVINRGLSAGLLPGHVLAIFQTGALVDDPQHKPRTYLGGAAGKPIVGGPAMLQLPDSRAGELLVFRIFEGISFGLVMNTQRPVHLLDHVRNP